LNILVIKQTSLGDVLHSTGHIRAIKQRFPESQLTLLTATTSYEIIRHNPYIDHVILFDRYAIKRQWWKQPLWALRHIASVLKSVRKQRFDIAIDLQGRLKSMLFLYTARAKRKFAKGRWLLVDHFSKREIHAIEEMNGVLQLAGVDAGDTSMEIHISEVERLKIEKILTEINPENRRIVVVSPFTRWDTKNWGIDHFVELCNRIPDEVMIAFTGSAERRAQIDWLIQDLGDRRAVNLAGRVTLLEFAELIRRSSLVITGDSFPMHLASALRRPLIALFGPTDEKRVGPVTPDAIVLRADHGCRRCYRRHRCSRNCIRDIAPATVLREALRFLDINRASCPLSGVR